MNTDDKLTKMFNSARFSNAIVTDLFLLRSAAGRLIFNTNDAATVTPADMEAKYEQQCEGVSRYIDGDASAWPALVLAHIMGTDRLYELHGLSGDIKHRFKLQQTLITALNIVLPDGSFDLQLIAIGKRREYNDEGRRMDDLASQLNLSLLLNEHCFGVTSPIAAEDVIRSYL